MTTEKPKKPKDVVLDYRSGETPDWVRHLIEVRMAIEDEDAKSAGALGFMTRALVLATMPYKDPKADSFTRVNGDFKLRIVAGYEGGIPFGIYPRLLMSWLTTEAVRTQSPVIELGASLSEFLRDVLDIRTTTGGARGSGTRITEQMKRLFGSMITAQYSGALNDRGFTLRNVLIADELHMSAKDESRLNRIGAGTGEDLPGLWVPQKPDEAGQWDSTVRLSTSFFRECVTNPVPIDLRAQKGLRSAPLAMDIYTWATYRMHKLTRASRPISWEALMGQFGAGFSSTVDDPGQAVRNFKKAFIKALQMVHVVYPEARIEHNTQGVTLLPSKPHVAPLPKRAALQIERTPAPTAAPARRAAPKKEPTPADAASVKQDDLF